MDPGSQRSYVRKDTVRCMKYAPIGEEQLIHRLFGGETTTGTRLATSIVKELEQKDITLSFWSDSSTVITWIKRDDNWGVFIWNQVQEIRELTSTESWRHVPGVMNPAYLPRRGCTVQLLQTRWWEGPAWLKQPAEDWPLGEPQPDEEVVEEERKKGIVSSLLCKEGQADWYYTFSCNYDKIVRILAWVLRFVNRCRKVGVKQGSGKVLQWEIMLAEKCVIR